MYKLSMFDHKSFLFEGFLTDSAQPILGRVDIDVSFFVTVKVAFAAQ